MSEPTATWVKKIIIATVRNIFASQQTLSHLTDFCPIHTRLKRQEAFSEGVRAHVVLGGLSISTRESVKIDTIDTSENVTIYSETAERRWNMKYRVSLRDRKVW